MGVSAAVAGGIGVAVLLLGAQAVAPAHPRGGACLDDTELVMRGVAVGDPRIAARRRLGPGVVVRRDTIRGADFDFGVTRYRAEHVEVVVSDATGRVAEIIARDSSAALPRGVRLGMLRAQVERLLAPALLGPAQGDTFTVVACGPRGSGMDLTFDRDAILRSASLTGFYPNGD